jgi:hypothetical protein
VFTQGAFAYEAREGQPAASEGTGHPGTSNGFGGNGFSPHGAADPFGAQAQQPITDCAMHPGRPAEAACVYCGRLFCADCLVEVNGRMYCKADVEKVINEAQGGANRQQAHSYQPNDNQAGAYGPQGSYTQQQYSQQQYAQQPYGQPPFGQQPFGQQPFVQPIHIHNEGMYPAGMNAFYPYRKRWIAALLCLLLGVLGVHRFYVGKIGTGLLWLFTGGLFGLGVLLDLIIIICGGFRDKAYMPLI